MKRFATLVSLLAAASLTFAAPVLAAAPSNDTYLNRTMIGSLPFNASVDTTAATTDGDDLEANAGCAPATDASVWYELTATSDASIIVDVSASNYSAGVVVVTGSPGSFTQVACGPGAVGFSALNGGTYAILAFDDQGDGGGNGGTLNITVDVGPPAPVVDVTVDPAGIFNKSGSATVSGTVTCNGDAEFTSIDVQLRQRAGRVFIDGFGSTQFTCDGTTRPWSVEVVGNGLFKGGKATATVNAEACGTFVCDDDFVQREISLRRK